MNHVREVNASLSSPEYIRTAMEQFFLPSQIDASGFELTVSLLLSLLQSAFFSCKRQQTRDPLRSSPSSYCAAERYFALLWNRSLPAFPFILPMGIFTMARSSLLTCFFSSLIIARHRFVADPRAPLALDRAQFLPLFPYALSPEFIPVILVLSF